MHDILKQTVKVDIVAWNVIQYMYNNKLGKLHVFLRRDESWVCFDSNPENDCEAYLDVVLNAVNGMIIGENE